MSDVRTIDTAAPGTELRAALAEDCGPVLVVDRSATPASDPAVLDHAVATLRTADGIATVSPVPVRVDAVTSYDLHELLPPAPSLALPCAAWSLVAPSAASSLGHLPEPADTAGAEAVRLGALLLRSGWRNVAAPGVALDWDPRAIADPPDRDASGTAVSPQVVGELVGPANLSLETHSTWARSRLVGLDVLVDGACLDGDFHTGTQHVVLEVSRAMQATRPGARVAVAVRTDHVESVSRHLEGTGVDVVERSPGTAADVLYRPYQMLLIDELEVFMTAGRRRLLGQLDMIGFSNPFYHPSHDLFRFARNLQRTLLRRSDGVTFISEYGRRSTLAECPDLVPSRLHVVGCGTDPTPTTAPRPPRDHLVGTRFVVATSATFWHKNRRHAIATFDALVRHEGYDGSLVIVGPEPYHGSSTADDRAFIDTLDPAVAGRIEFLGRVADAEKWWLLDHADAVLYPSVIEGFGLVPFEAASVGTPTLVFAGTAPAELLRGSRAAIDVWHADAWAEQIARWVDDPDEARHAVEEILDGAARLTWHSTASATWEAIDATLAQPPVANHVQEGPPAHHVSADSRTGRRATLARFTISRVIAAVQRRTARWRQSQ